jgi:uncharacterized protein (TIGR02118 family)
MPVISVIYPRSEGDTFDYEYYENTHLPLVAARWGGAGLSEARALRGVATPDGGDAPFFVIALLHFTSLDAMRAATGGEHAAEIFGDIANFTGVRPVIQINDPIGAP